PATAPSEQAGAFARPNRCGIVPPLERTARSTRLETRCHRPRERTVRAVQDRSAGASGSILATALPLDSAAADLAHGRLRDQPDRALRAWLADDLMAAPARVACTAIGSQRSTTSVQLCGRFGPAWLRIPSALPAVMLREGGGLSSGHVSVRAAVLGRAVSSRRGLSLGGCRLPKLDP